MDLNPAIVPGGLRMPWHEKPDPHAKLDKQARCRRDRAEIAPRSTGGRELHVGEKDLGFRTYRRHPSWFQASKLKVRVKALLQALGAAAFDVPHRIHEGHSHPIIIMIIVMIIAYSHRDLAPIAGLLFLCTKRLTWPEGFLLPSEQKALRPMPGGALAPSSTSPALLTINLLIVRVVIQQLLLRPKVRVTSREQIAAVAAPRVLAYGP